MAKIISVLSGKGGVGKTFIATSLGVALSRRGAKVLLVDGDMGLRNMDLVLGLENDCFYHIIDVAEGRCFRSEAILEAGDGLDFLAASPKDSWNEIFPAAIDTVLEDTQDRYDFIIIDCPAGIGRGIDFSMKVSDLALIVVAPTWASKRNAEKVAMMWPKKKKYYFLLNQFDEDDQVKLSFGDVIESMDLESFAGVVPYVKETAQTAGEGRLIHDETHHVIWKALSLVVETVLRGKEYPLSRWKAILRAGMEENGAFDKKQNRLRKRRSGLDWDKRRMSYKWRGRR